MAGILLEVYLTIVQTRISFTKQICCHYCCFCIHIYGIEEGMMLKQIGQNLKNKLNFPQYQEKRYANAQISISLVKAN